jgi:HicA toxin of bacterial toxin-antitoxin,
MGKCEKLLEKAKNSPANISFTEICKLAVCYGWIFIRQSGSHRMYEHPDLDVSQGRFQNFQDDRGKAKPYQVKQLLAAIENL